MGGLINTLKEAPKGLAEAIAHVAEHAAHGPDVPEPPDLSAWHDTLDDYARMIGQGYKKGQEIQQLGERGQKAAVSGEESAARLTDFAAKLKEQEYNLRNQYGTLLEDLGKLDMSKQESKDQLRKIQAQMQGIDALLGRGRAGLYGQRPTSLSKAPLTGAQIKQQFGADVVDPWGHPLADASMYNIFGVPGGEPVFALTGDQKSTSVAEQKMQDWLVKHPGKGPSDYEAAMKVLGPAFSFNLQAQGAPARAGTASGKTGEDFLSTLPKQRANLVKALAEGRIPMPSSFALRTPYWQSVMNDLTTYDPEFNVQRADLRRDYTTGKQSQEINAINTALGHAGVLADAIDALKNGNVKALNLLANQAGVQVGKTPVTTFSTIVHRLGPELTKAYIQSGGTLGERGTNEEDFNPNLGPDQLKTNVAITTKLLRSKIGSLENQWNQNASPGMQKFGDRFIMPSAKRVLDTLSPNEGIGQTGSSGPPPGATHIAPGSDGKKHYTDSTGRDLGVVP